LPTLRLAVKPTRTATGERAYAELVTDLETALRQLDRHERGGGPPGGAGRGEED
jgi:hypothetical protein